MTGSVFTWEAAERRGTGSCKWDDAPSLFGAPDVLPMWVADMDFPAPPVVLDALRRVLDHGVLGYPSARQDGAAQALSGRFRDLGVPRSSVPGIVGLEAAYTHGEQWLESLLVHLSGNAAFLVDAVRTRLSPLRLRRPEATYLAWIDCRALGLDEAGLESFFSKDAKVGLNRGGMFGAPGVGWMRLNFGTSRALVEEAVGRIEGALHRR